MNPEKVIELLHDLLEKARLSDILSVGNEMNESADIMWFSSKAKVDYLAVYEKPLFPFSCIENITYKYKNENDNRLIAFKYTEDLCILTFHLKGNCLLLIECDKDGLLNLYFNSSPDDNSKWTDNTNEFKSAVSNYSLSIEKREVFEGLIYSLFDSLEDQHLDMDLCDKQHRIIFDYLLNNKNDAESLFLYAYEAANYISIDYKDYPHFADIIKEIANRNLENELLVYVRKRCLEYNWDDNDKFVYNMTLQNVTEKIISQLKAVDSDGKPS